MVKRKFENKHKIQKDNEKTTESNQKILKN